MRSTWYAHMVVLLAFMVVAAIPATRLSAEPVLVYSEDWSHGSGGWGGIGGFRAPSRFFVGHPIAPYAWYFGGACGMGIRSAGLPPLRMKLATLVYMVKSNRNGFSVNVRDRGGSLIYKYSMGAGNRVDANCQPPSDTISTTELPYLNNVPYELFSIWQPGTGRFAIGLKNIVTGEERLSGRSYACRGMGTPAVITFDQEGGQGPAFLGYVKVWLGE